MENSEWFNMESLVGVKNALDDEKRLRQDPPSDIFSRPSDIRPFGVAGVTVCSPHELDDVYTRSPTRNKKTKDSSKTKFDKSGRCRRHQHIVIAQKRPFAKVSSSQD